MSRVQGEKDKGTILDDPVLKVVLMLVECDGKLLGCTQCANSKRACPGYRSVVDLVFKEGTLGERATSLRDNQQRTRAQPTNANAVSKKGAIPSAVPSGMMVPVQEFARNYFVRTIVHGTETPAVGLYSTIEQLHAFDEVDECLSASLSATSLASFKHVAHREDLSATHAKEYGRALRLVNTALSSNSSAVRDSSLLAVLVLSTYEMIRGTSTPSVDTWRAHVLGTSNLVKLRGPRRLESHHEKLLFSNVVQFMLITCLGGTLPFSDHIINAVRVLRDSPGEIGAWMKQLHVILQINQVLARTTCEPEGALVRDLLKYDQKLRDVCDQTMQEFHYNNVDADQDPRPLLSKEALDSLQLSANHWNIVRTVRFHLHLGILRWIPSIDANPPTVPDQDSQHEATLATSTYIALRLQEEILATVPQQLGQVNRADQRERTPSQTPGKTDQTSSARAFELVWPLWVIGKAPTADVRTKSYCADTLDLIGAGVGVRQATLFAWIVRGMSWG